MTGFGDRINLDKFSNLFLLGHGFRLPTNGTHAPAGGPKGPD